MQFLQCTRFAHVISILRYYHCFASLKVLCHEQMNKYHIIISKFPLLLCCITASVRYGEYNATDVIGGMVKTATRQNGDRNGYIQNGDKPKQHLQLLTYMEKMQYSIARNA